MKSLQPNHIDETASHWAARLDGGALTDHDHAALSAWLNANPEHRRAFENYSTLSAQIGSHIDVRLGAAAEAAAQAKATARKWRRAIIATTLATAAAAAIALLLTVIPRSTHDFSTITAERRMTTLDDGSQVELNAQTTLTVAFNKTERLVRLVSGEAFFAVTKDSRRPFVIETPTGTVRVIGTVFNVRTTNAAHVEVTVLEGNVRVRSSGDSVREQSVAAGLQAVLSENNIAVRTLPEGAAHEVIAWRQGQVVFNDTPLGEAIEHFAAYHARTITVEPKAADLRLGGRYSLDDLNGLLDSIEAVLPVRVQHGPGTDLRISAVVTPTQ